ncbi:MAG: TauD/TfdA family dioxygenase, partial [Rhodospirillaceae bacterium]|nr:TauD/TfdA family dioxygenase [Rhodospirillaceae bacterium]
DEAAQMRFATLFGPISHRGVFMKTRDFTHVSNAREDGILGGGVLDFHSDHTFFRHPLRAICLYAIEVPGSGGETLFSNAAMAWANLPADLKARIQGRRSLQLFDYNGDYNRRCLERDAAADAPRCWHPLMLHDKAGGTVLFVHPLTTAAIDDLSEPETDALIDELAGYIADPTIGYRHTWRPGDVLIWNNMALQHARTDFDPSERRTLRRMPIAVSEAEARDETATAA